MTRYYRIQPADRDTTDLLDPERQYSAPWHGGIERPCPTCTDIDATHDPADCTDCDGHQWVEDIRDGISACDSLDALYAYWQVAGGDLDDAVIVEMDATRSTDRDHDADLGAVLVHPYRIVSVTPVTDEIAEQILTAPEIV